MKEKIYQRGITMVALVITVIILLILAGVTISTVVSDNGLIVKAKKAAEEYKNSEEKEKSGLEEMEQILASQTKNEGSGGSSGTDSQIGSDKIKEIEERLSKLEEQVSNLSEQIKNQNIEIKKPVILYGEGINEDVIGKWSRELSSHGSTVTVMSTNRLYLKTGDIITAEFSLTRASVYRSKSQYWYF